MRLVKFCCFLFSSLAGTVLEGEEKMRREGASVPWLRMALVNVLGALHLGRASAFAAAGPCLLRGVIRPGTSPMAPFSPSVRRLPRALASTLRAAGEWTELTDDASGNGIFDPSNPPPRTFSPPRAFVPSRAVVPQYSSYFCSEACPLQRQCITGMRPQEKPRGRNRRRETLRLLLRLATRARSRRRRDGRRCSRNSSPPWEHRPSRWAWSASTETNFQSSFLRH